MTLNVTTTGSGPRLTLLHGWGLNSSVWEPVLPRLAQRFTTVAIDLPGHGASTWPPEFHDIDSLADLIAPYIEGGYLLGWSLGGMAALALAARPQIPIERLVLVAAKPRFTRSDDWPYGNEERVLEGFATRMRASVSKTLQEFLALQVQGDERARATLRTLRNQILAAGEPRAAALDAGLDVLRTTDLRDRLSRIAVPALVICGERDRLTMPSACTALAAALPHGQLYSFKRAAHAPFTSHPEEFCAAVEQFLQ